MNTRDAWRIALTFWAVVLVLLVLSLSGCTKEVSEAAANYAGAAFLLVFAFCALLFTLAALLRWLGGGR